jgi:hypothetical protein
MVVTKHVRVHATCADAGGRGQVAKSPSGGVTVPASSGAVAQDRTCDAALDRTVHGAAYRGREWDECGLFALAVHLEHAVTPGLAECRDVGAGGLEDPQSE